MDHLEFDGPERCRDDGLYRQSITPSMPPEINPCLNIDICTYIYIYNMMVINIVHTPSVDSRNHRSVVMNKVAQRPAEAKKFSRRIRN